MTNKKAGIIKTFGFVGETKVMRHVLAWSLLLGVLASAYPGGARRAEAVPPPNIILILTDDQRWDTLWAMDKVQLRLVQKGTTFANAFVTTPLCCPTRSSLYSGGYLPKNTNVLTNLLPNGSVSTFTDIPTLGTLIKQNGYATGFIGKYMNKYDTQLAPYVPPGWSKFIGLNDDSDWNNFTVVVGSSTATQSSTGTVQTITQYMTDYLRDQALAFIDQYKSGPFLLIITPKAPHGPATPAPGDENLFSTFTNTRPNVNEADLSDKPQWLQAAADPTDDATAFARNQLRSLQAVDRMVSQIYIRLNTHNLVNKTNIAYTSDNGFMWGEHAVQKKTKPYEESIRVPLVIRGPGIVQGVTSTYDVAMNLDLGTTILRWAGLNTVTDGLDLRDILDGGPPVSWPRENGIMFQSFSKDNLEKYTPPLWSAWRTKLYKLIEYPQSGEKEFYDLTADPYEMSSQHSSSSFATLISQYSANIAANEGLINYMATTSLPAATTSVPYSYQFPARGGTTPYAWSTTGTNPLPPGLTLGASTGILSGTPTQSGSYTFKVQVIDSSTSAQNGKHQSFIVEGINLLVNP